MTKILIDEATMKLVLEKIKAARDCHPNAVDTLLFEAEEILEEALADQPAQQEPVYVQTRHKEEHGFSEWGSLLDPTHRNSKWAEGVEMRLLYTSPPAQPAQQEPTKAMIDAAERLDWSDSDVRGNIVNMWQAMLAAAPQPAQRKPLTVEEFEVLHHKAKGYVHTGLMDVVRIVEHHHNIKENT